jgi:hypothetical protein
MLGEYEGRPNKRLAESVDEVIRAAEAQGRQHAARLMSARGVPFSVAVRVLAEPNKRWLVTIGVATHALGGAVQRSVGNIAMGNADLT